MEIIVIGCILTPLTLTFCFIALKELVKQLQSGESKKLLTPGNTIEFSCSITSKDNSKDKKNEVCDTNTNSIKNDLD